jgi:hypothetical protein
MRLKAQTAAQAVVGNEMYAVPVNSGTENFTLKPAFM